MMISFRLTKIEEKALRKVAKAEGINLSATIIRALMMAYPDFMKSRIEAVLCKTKTKTAAD